MNTVAVIGNKSLFTSAGKNYTRLKVTMHMMHVILSYTTVSCTRD